MRRIAGARDQPLLGMARPRRGRDAPIRRRRRGRLRRDSGQAHRSTPVVARGLFRRGTQTSATSCTETPPRLGFTSTRSNGSFDKSQSGADRLEVGLASRPASSPSCALSAVDVLGGARHILRFLADAAHAARRRGGAAERAGADGLAAEQRAKDRRADRDGGAHLRAGGLLALHLHGLLGPAHPILDRRQLRRVLLAHLGERGVARFARFGCRRMRKSRSDSSGADSTLARELLKSSIDCDCAEPPRKVLLPGRVVLRLRGGSRHGRERRAGRRGVFSRSSTVKSASSARSQSTATGAVGDRRDAR